MIECEITISVDSVNDLISVLTDQSEDMVPNEYSRNEDEYRTPINLFIIKSINDIVGFLWAQRCVYEINLTHTSQITLLAISNRVDEIREIIDRLSTLSVGFGYAASTEERIHRNKIIAKKDYGFHEGWVGRDSNRYLPGIYWITIIPLALMRQHGISIDKIRSIPALIDIKGNLNALVTLYDSPFEWKSKADNIDAWCQNTEGCFSKYNVGVKAQKASSFLEMSILFSKYP